MGMLHVLQENIEHPAGPLIHRLVTVIDGPDDADFEALNAQFTRAYGLHDIAGKPLWPGGPGRDAFDGQLAQVAEQLRAQGADPGRGRYAEVFRAWLTLQPGFTAVPARVSQVTLDTYDYRGE